MLWLQIDDRLHGVRRGSNISINLLTPNEYYVINKPPFKNVDFII